MRKQVLLLSGVGYILPVIDACHQLGYKAVACDDLPDNIIHKYLDLYHNKHGFTVPKAKGYDLSEDALSEGNQYRWPVIVNPEDSVGAKGVSKVDSPDQLKEVAEYARMYSKSHWFIVEELIKQPGSSFDKDCFTVDGKLIFASFKNQRFDKNASNPYTPAAYAWFSGMPLKIQTEPHCGLQLLISLFNLKSSIYNVETRQGEDAKPILWKSRLVGKMNIV